MKKCPACGKEYEDANTLCPADGAVLRRAEGDDPLVGQVLAGKYRIEEKIDEGGMGCVYRATHVLMEKTIAVKVLHPALAADDKIVARFTREAKAASRISHPHAIVVTDFGESEQGVVYLVMEYLRGRTLKDVIRAEGPMSLERVSEIVRQVAGALEAAHEQGVVHRDLKSDNIMLEETAGGDWAKVLDFGIAKIQETAGKPEDGLTAPNLIIGTPQYMSPEQCGQTSDIDQRTDIYSFGVILFEMFAGHVPFTGDSPTAIMMKHIQEPPPSILEERPDLPAGVGRVVARALAKRPEDRFERAGEVHEALVGAAAEEAAATTAAAVAATETDRIVVPTAPNDAPRTTSVVEDDEATVVSAETRRPRTDELPGPVAPLPEPATGFNPWSIALPAIAALAVVFAVFFAYQRFGSASEPTPAGPPLNADPNSQPVQPVAPATGQAETNLPASSTPTPASAGVPGGAPLTTADPGSFQTGETPATPTPQPGEQQGRPQGGANANQNTPPEEEPEEEEEPQPTPQPSPRRQPSPEGPVVKPPPDAPPPPRPTPKPDTQTDSQLSDPPAPSTP